MPVKTNYWALKLRISTIIRLLKSLNRHSQVGLTYVEKTRPAAMLLKYVNKRFPTSLSIREIGQRHGQAGPLMNLAFVRDDQNRVITIPIYHHILEIRRKIVIRLLDVFKSIDFFKNEKSLNMIAAYFGMEIAKDITPAVYMAHYACWVDYKPGCEEKVKHILVIPDSPWSSDLTAAFKEYVDHVVIDKKQKRLRLLVKVASKLIRAVLAVAMTKLSGGFVHRKSAEPMEALNS
ncbi:hypothetical protein ACFLRB_06245 [Acidobacteriota bacterium]